MAAGLAIEPGRSIAGIKRKKNGESDRTMKLKLNRPTVVLAALVLFCLNAASAQADPRIKLFAHRGFCLTAPENSLAAIRAAMELGLDGTEIDVRTTRDEELILMHDPNLARTTDGTGTVDQVDLARLKKLKLKDKQGRLTAESPPTLARALALVAGRPGFRLALDIKAADPARVARMVVSAELKDRVFFFISNPQQIAVIDRIRSIDPGLKISVDLLSWWKIEGLPTFITNALKADALFASEWFFPRFGFDEAAEAGAEVMVFLWGDHDLIVRAKRAAQLGAKVVSSNRPDLLLQLAQGPEVN